MKRLIVVESPTKAEKIKHILGKDYSVLASYGSICDLAKGNKFGIGIDVNNNFKTTYLITEGKKAALQAIIDKAEESDEIYLFSDADREGHAISYHIQRYLKSSNKPIKICLIREITEKGIEEAFKSAGEIDINIFHSQEARRILDRIVGFMVSPYLMNFYGSNLSAGRVQSVAVRMITDRERDIDDFKPEEYWNIFAKFKTDNKEEFATKFNDKIENKNKSEEILKQIKEEQVFSVAAVKKQNKKEKPPPPLTTASIQQFMAKKYNFDPERTMKSAQNLYENGYCTYIRTDSTRIADDAIDTVRVWIKENKFDVPKSPNVYKTKSTAQDAHECIRPTNVKNLPSTNLFSGDDKLVYDTIWKFFVASQMESAIYNTLQITIKSNKNPKLIFTVSGKALEYKGYLEIFGNIDLEKIELPNLTKDQVLTISNTKSEQKFTKPPARYNAALILEELEKREIGRPSTYAEIIKKIAARNYVEKEGNIYKPTDLGKKITKILSDNFSFMSYDFTAKFEILLDKIADGSTTRNIVLNEFFTVFNSELMKSYDKNNVNKIICKKCSSPAMQREGQFGKYILCVNATCKKIDKLL